MLSFFEKQSLRYENDNEKRKDCFKNVSKSLFFKNGRFLRPSFWKTIVIKKNPL